MWSHMARDKHDENNSTNATYISSNADVTLKNNKLLTFSSYTENMSHVYGILIAIEGGIKCGRGVLLVDYALP